MIRSLTIASLMILGGCTQALVGLTLPQYTDEFQREAARELRELRDGGRHSHVVTLVDDYGRVRHAIRAIEKP